MSDQILAKNKLLEGGYSCVLVKDGNIIMTSRDKGVTPLFSKLTEDKPSLKDATIADKVVGKALALLCLFAGITSVYAYTMSECAEILLKNKGIYVEYNKIVPYIMNRDRTNRCLMEKLVDNMEDPQKAFDAISSFFGKEPPKGSLTANPKRVEIGD